jgi:hypothetical protein
MANDDEADEGPLVLVQTWVPKSLHAWAKSEAKKKGLSLAAWLRMKLLDEKRVGEPS